MWYGAGVQTMSYWAATTEGVVLGWNNKSCSTGEKKQTCCVATAEHVALDWKHEMSCCAERQGMPQGAGDGTR
eukprot:9331428-Pyramimonas_sp.AAC.1